MLAMSCGSRAGGAGLPNPLQMGSFVENRQVASQGHGVKWQSKFYPMLNDLRVDSVFVRKFNGFVSDTIDGHKTIPAIISLLLLWCGPSAVLRRIALAVIDAVEGVTFRSRADIRDEVEKPLRVRFSPTVAYCYSSAAVILELLKIRIIATTKHSVESTVERVLRRSAWMVFAHNRHHKHRPIECQHRMDKICP